LYAWKKPRRRGEVSMGQKDLEGMTVVIVIPPPPKELRVNEPPEQRTTHVGVSGFWITVIILGSLYLWRVLA
jgi:hypothetical protein